MFGCKYPECDAWCSIAHTECCSSHKCVADGCSKVRVSGSTACVYHKCVMSSCLGLCDVRYRIHGGYRIHSGYCDKHVCSMCHAQRSRMLFKQHMCEQHYRDHMCVVTACNEPCMATVLHYGSPKDKIGMWYSRHCRDHACSVERCEEPLLSPHRVCASHLPIPMATDLHTMRDMLRKLEDRLARVERPQDELDRLTNTTIGRGSGDDARALTSACSAVQQADCVVCMNAPREVVIMSCKHYVMCQSCANGITDAKCPVCRQDYTDVMRVYSA